MVKKKTIKRYIDKRWKKTLFYIRRFTKTPDPALIHPLRVEIKKLRAVGALMKFTHRSALNHALKPAKEIFRRAGVLRDRQMQLESVKKAGLRSTDGFSGETKIFSDDFISFSGFLQKQYKKKDQIRDNLVREVKGISSAGIIHYYRHFLSFLISVFNHPQQTENWHGSRRIIKSLLYNYNLLDKKMKKKIGLDESYLQSLEKKIGDWHDALLSQQLIERIAPGKLRTKEIARQRTERLTQSILRSTVRIEEQLRLPQENI